MTLSLNGDLNLSWAKLSDNLLYLISWTEKVNKIETETLNELTVG